MPRSARSEEGISNTLGFVIISGILLTSVAIVFVIGLPVYNKYVDQSHLQNMIEGFDLISENANNVALLKTPYQQSELKLYEGTIALKDTGTLQVECFDASGNPVPSTGSGNSVTSDSIPLRIVEYTKGDSNIAYLLGGVFRKDDYSYPVVKRPEIYTYIDKNNNPVLVMPLITLYNNHFSLAGTTLARISFSTLYYSKKNQVVDQPVLHTYTGVKTVRITIENSEYDDAIYRLLTEDEDGTPDDYDLHFDKDTSSSTPDKLVMTKTYSTPITVNTVQTTIIVTINKGSV